MTIHKLNTFLVLTTSITLACCNFSEPKSKQIWSELPETTNLESLKSTIFVATLETPIQENKNIIYAPALLYAWDKIKTEVKDQIIVNDSNSSDFKLLNQSITHHNSLTETEYVVTSENVEGLIAVRAFFNKTLPYETSLQSLETPIHFGQTKVAAFGMYYFDYDLVKFSQVLYYKDNDHFILKLLPKDKQHEIILVKGVDKYKRLIDAVHLVNELIEKGKQEKTDAKQLWKYEIVHYDKFAIPSIKFNIETQYNQLEGQRFTTTHKNKYAIETAYQRTGFILNETGAVVESEAMVTLDSSAAPEIQTSPKEMIFDKQFIIILKRTNQPNPYFVMKVDNAELLIKE